MPTEAQFEVVSDELRTAPRASRRAPWIDVVLEGKTIRLEMPQDKLGGYYKTFQKEGLKLRTKADGTHTIVWAESPPKNGTK